MLSEKHVRDRLRALEPRRLPTAATTSHAAVATVLRWGGGEPEVLLIKRSERPFDPWSGHMAFPGGRQSPGDADLVATAVRETFEEVGVDLNARGELLGRLHDVQAIARARPTDLVIVPQVFRIEGPVQLMPEPGEVEEALWAPLSPMRRGETLTTVTYEHQGRRFDLPGYQVGRHVVWGLTFRMIETLFEALDA
jgi:8-oxo-dGTP pyrophosphatase MutT (NUDIX family)